MIHEEICTYEVCKLAKEKGFPQEPKENNHSDMYSCDGSGTMPVLCSWCVWLMEACDRNNLYAAPTQSLLQRWLREEKGIVVEVTCLPTTRTISKYEYKRHLFWGSDGHYTEGEYGDDIFDTYELALEDVLKYALENLV